MAQSDLEVANGALIKLGCGTIASLASAYHPAPVMSARVDVCKRAVLRIHPWNFAIKRAELALSTITGCASNGAPNLIRVTSAAHPFNTSDRVTVIGVLGTHEANGTWVITDIGANTFDLQASVFTNAYISGGQACLAPAYGYSFAYTLPSDFIRLLTLNDDDPHPQYALEGGKLLTDEVEPQIRYIYNVTDYTTMDTMFYEALQAYLAWDVCIKITQSEGLKDRMWLDFKEIIRKARFVDATEDSTRIIEATDWLESRFGANAGYVRDPQT